VERTIGILKSSEGKIIQLAAFAGAAEKTANYACAVARSEEEKVVNERKRLAIKRARLKKEKEVRVTLEQQKATEFATATAIQHQTHETNRTTWSENNHFYSKGNPTHDGSIPVKTVSTSGRGRGKGRGKMMGDCANASKESMCQQQLEMAVSMHEQETKKLLKESADNGLSAVPVDKITVARELSMQLMAEANNALKLLGSSKSISDTELTDKLAKAEQRGVSLFVREEQFIPSYPASRKTKSLSAASNATAPDTLADQELRRHKMQENGISGKTNVNRSNNPSAGNTYQEIQPMTNVNRSTNPSAGNAYQEIQPITNVNRSTNPSAGNTYQEIQPIKPYQVYNHQPLRQPVHLDSHGQNWNGADSFPSSRSSTHGQASHYSVTQQHARQETSNKEVHYGTHGSELSKLYQTTKQSYFRTPQHQNVLQAMPTGHRTDFDYEQQNSRMQSNDGIPRDVPLEKNANHRDLTNARAQFETIYSAPGSDVANAQGQVHSLQVGQRSNQNRSNYQDQLEYANSYHLNDAGASPGLSLKYQETASNNSNPQRFHRAEQYETYPPFDARFNGCAELNSVGSHQYFPPARNQN